MKWVKRILVSLLVFLVVLIFIYGTDIIYGLRQLQGQVKIIRGAEDLELYLENPDNPDSIKYKLELIQKAKQFAIRELEFNDTDNYTTVYDQKGEDILWIVTASLPFKLEPKIWKFPILGEVSYKGHFNLERAISEAKELEKQNWDVSVRTVTAWSTLGWFKDPILTGMLQRNDGELAELILHELTHGTLFVKDSVDFNENLASFIGERATQLFLAKEFGDNSKELIQYRNDLDDQRRITEFMLKSASKLDSLYATFPQDLDTATMKNSKEEMINHIVQSLDTVSFNSKKDYQDFFKKRKPNNAFFMSFIRYKSMEKEFEQLLDSNFDGNLKSFLNYYRSNYPSL